MQGSANSAHQQSRVIKFRAWDIQTNTMHEVGDNWRIHQAFGERNVIPMQFTGLHDKNGKEIYEGDIVRYGAYKTVMRWEAGFQGVDGEYCAGYDLAGPFPESCEVVGNIWENPELLKEAA